MVLAFESRVVAYENGAMLWERALPDHSSRLGVFDDCVLAPTTTALHCLDLKNGSDLWVAKRPNGESQDITSLATHGNQALFVTDAGQVQALDHDACAAKSKAKAKATPCLRNLDIYVDAFGNEVGFAFAQDGYWMIGESNRLRLYSPNNTEIWSRGGYESDMPVADGKYIAVLSGPALLRIDVTACADNPKTCATTMSTLGEDAVGGPVLLPDGSVVVIEEAGVVAAYGDTKWKVDAGNDGPLVVSGDSGLLRRPLPRTRQRGKALDVARDRSQDRGYALALGPAWSSGHCRCPQLALRRPLGRRRGGSDE